MTPWLVTVPKSVMVVSSAFVSASSVERAGNVGVALVTRERPAAVDD
jgi:hypothetical protein